MSRTVANIYRRADAHRIIPLPLSQSELEARSKAEAASKALLNHCLRSNSIPADNPPRTLSFAEQLEAVASGKARIAPAFQFRTACNQRGRV